MSITREYCLTEKCTRRADTIFSYKFKVTASVPSWHLTIRDEQDLSQYLFILTDNYVGRGIGALQTSILLASLLFAKRRCLRLNRFCKVGFRFTSYGDGYSFTLDPIIAGSAAFTLIP